MEIRNDKQYGSPQCERQATIESIGLVAVKGASAAPARGGSPGREDDLPLQEIAFVAGNEMVFHYCIQLYACGLEPKWPSRIKNKSNENRLRIQDANFARIQAIDRADQLDVSVLQGTLRLRQLGQLLHRPSDIGLHCHVQLFSPGDPWIDIP